MASKKSETTKKSNAKIYEKTIEVGFRRDRGLWQPLTQAAEEADTTPAQYMLDVLEKDLSGHGYTVAPGSTIYSTDRRRTKRDVANDMEEYDILRKSKNLTEDEQERMNGLAKRLKNSGEEYVARWLADPTKPVRQILLEKARQEREKRAKILNGETD